MRALAAAGAVSLIGAAPGSAADQLFVDRDSRGGQCNDQHSMSDAAAPLTPMCGLSRALAVAPAGSTIYLREGAYPKLVVGRREPSQAVTVRPYGSEPVTLAGLDLRGTAGLTVQGLSLSAGVVVGPNASGITLADNDFEPAGVTIQEGSSGIRIEGNRITSPRGSGVHFSAAPDETPIRDVAIRGNHFDGIGATGVNARSFEDVLIEGNEFEGVRSHNGIVHPNVIRTYGGGTGLVVKRNFIHDNKAICFFIKDGLVTDVLLENNLIVRNDGYGFQVYNVDGIALVNNTITHNFGGVLFRGDATEVVIKNNILASLNYPRASTDLEYEDYNYVGQGTPGGTGEHDIGGPIEFADIAALDYALVDGSPAIDAGTSEGTPIRDRLARHRTDAPDTPNRGGGLLPFYDLGALEFGAGVLPPGSGGPGPVTIPEPPPPTVPGTPRPGPSALAAGVEYALPVAGRGRKTKSPRWLAVATASRRARGGGDRRRHPGGWRSRPPAGGRGCATSAAAC